VESKEGILYESNTMTEIQYHQGQGVDSEGLINTQALIRICVPLLKANFKGHSRKTMSKATS